MKKTIIIFFISLFILLVIKTIQIINEPNQQELDRDRSNRKSIGQPQN